MKKLLFATAIAASAAALADPINAISFENSQYASIDNATNLTGRADIPDPGRSDTGTYFLYEANSGSSDSSFVTNAAAAFTDKGTAYFAGLMENEDFSNQKYLALDTEGGTLWRSINTIGTGALGEARTVAATGTYLDTLVQFTVTEDDAPAVGEGDKLAIWLQAGEGTTNLMVKAGYYNASGTFITGGTNFVLSGVTVEPGQWYRLTVKAIDDVIDQSYEYASYYKLPVFTIQIDGTYLTANEPTMASAYTTGLSSGAISQETATAFESGKYFLNMVKGTHGTATTLQGVGFKGTGAVDEIVWTEEDPFPAAPTVVDFVLTLDTTDAHVDTISITTNGAPVVFDSGTAQIPSNTVVTIEAAPTFTDSYVLDTLTVGGISMTEFPTNFTMEADTTVAITSVLPVLNPTVDGTTVEPANVFNTAITTKPIVYPTAPTLAGTAGVDQTIMFNGVTVNVPTYYDATLAGTTVSLSVNTNAIPAIGEATVESEEKAAIEVGATTFTTTLTTTNTKLYYGLKTATTPNAAEWTVGTLTQGTGAAMQIQADKPTVSGDTASAGFFKLYVTDVAPVTP